MQVSVIVTPSRSKGAMVRRSRSSIGCGLTEEEALASRSRADGDSRNRHASLRIGEALSHRTSASPGFRCRP